MEDANGNSILTFSPAKKYQSIVISSPSLVEGNNYSLYVDGSSTGSSSDGLYENGIYNPGNLSKTFTLSGTVTNLTGN